MVNYTAKEKEATAGTRFDTNHVAAANVNRRPSLTTLVEVPFQETQVDTSAFSRLRGGAITEAGYFLPAWQVYV